MNPEPQIPNHESSATMLEPYFHTPETEAGLDEAGRGCLAGPVAAAAVILPRDFDLPGLNDSKKLSAKKRDALRTEIERQALAWAVAMIDNTQIDKLNIFRASYAAMHEAVRKLGKTPDFLLVDGKFFIPYETIPYTCIIKGDGKYASIAAASVLAKTHRDEYMLRLHKAYPVYQWDKNKGYPTKSHRKAIREHGITPYHRRSFRLTDEQTEIPFKNMVKNIQRKQK